MRARAFYGLSRYDHRVATSEKTDLGKREDRRWEGTEGERGERAWKESLINLRHAKKKSRVG